MLWRSANEIQVDDPNRQVFTRVSIFTASLLYLDFKSLILEGSSAKVEGRIARSYYLPVKLT